MEETTWPVVRRSSSGAVGNDSKWEETILFNSISIFKCTRHDDRKIDGVEMAVKNSRDYNYALSRNCC